MRAPAFRRTCRQAAAGTFGPARCKSSSVPGASLIRQRARAPEPAAIRKSVHKRNTAHGKDH
eukprot:10988733-Alexandrium_andersonii.AAC.1